MANRYRYKVCNIDGRWVRGKLLASSEQEAVRRLQAAGVYVACVVPMRRRRWRKLSDPVYYISDQDRIFLLESWAMLLEAGLPISSALLTLRMRSRSKSVAGAIEQVQQGLEEGMRLTESIREARLFPPSWLAVLAVGEAQGDFVPLLKMLHRYALESRRFKQQLRSMWVRPCILLALVGIWVWLFVNRVMPSLLDLLGGVQAFQAVPAWIRWGSEVVVNSVRWSPLALTLLVLFSLWNRRSDGEGWLTTSWTPLSMPILGSLVRQLHLIQVAKGLQLQIEAGIPLTQAVELIGRSSAHRAVRQDLLQAYRKLQEGIPVPEAFCRIRIIPQSGQALLAVGQEAGRLPEMLDFLVKETQDNLLEEVHRLQVLVQHFVVVLTGMLVGGLVVTYFSLIFSGISHLPEMLASSQTYFPAP